jgi:hypothetical protein
MQSPASLMLTASYHAEEQAVIEAVLSTYAIKHFIAVGCAQLRYINTALLHCQTYIAVEKYLEDHMSAELQNYVKQCQNIILLEKDFGHILGTDLPQGRKLFLFLFNVYPYIDNAFMIQQKLAKPDDIIIVSSWNSKSSASWQLRDHYERHMKDHTKYASPIKIYDYMDEAEKDVSSFCAKTERIKGKITDILIGYV